MATNGMVATSQPLAAMAGLRMLMNGGSAVDAAVAAAATLNVVEPQATGAGGDLFALVYNASDKKVYSLNASGHSPAAASAEELRNKGMRSIPDNSPYSVTVPGAVSGWQALLDRFGKMSMSEVLKPAIAYATGGYPVSEVISMQWQGAAAKLEASPSGSELLLDGRA
ncbi:MAG: gamma-glutamyltransferase, partial [Chloroflexi bacterium]|nr:gamma-glutamyltransferase [Chloroflexota bacterium]